MKITMFQLNIHHIKGESGWEIRAHDPMSFPMILALYHQDHSPIYPHQKSPDSPIYPPKITHFFFRNLTSSQLGPDMPMMAIMASRPLANSWDGGYLAIISWISPKLVGRWMDIGSAWTRGKMWSGLLVQLHHLESLSMGRMTSHIWNEQYKMFETTNQWYWRKWLRLCYPLVN